MANFIISTDSCVDHFKSYLSEKNVHYIILKRITNSIETEEMYDSETEFEAFYNDIKKGALPRTSQLNLFELQEYFASIMQGGKGDLIHLPLSGGLSGTCENAKLAAEAVNKTLEGRKIHVIDSLSASRGMAYLVDRLIEMRDQGMKTEEAVEKIQYIRDHMQIWVIVGNLFHLKRGGRLSAIKAAVGTLIKVKPIMIINNKGKLVVENTVKGNKKSIAYLMEKLQKLGVEAKTDFFEKPIYLLHSCEKALAAELEAAIKEKYPQAKVNFGLVGPIIGTHLGDGSVAIAFEGEKTLGI